MHRFFLTGTKLVVGQIVDLAPVARQLNSVLRLPVGAQIILLDGLGNQFLVELQQLTRDHTFGLVLQQQPATSEPTLQLTLYQCSLKADKFEWVLQKGTELGVARFVPVISERSIVRPAEALLKKYERWQSILREAAEQCGRGCIPDLASPVIWTAAIQQATGLKLLPWEENAGHSNSLQHCLAEHPKVDQVNLLIGPEGGITADEVKSAKNTGWQVVSLGSRILRAETAALAGTTLILASYGEFG
ncbi:MAG: RsmE family RNA methyltransferase [Caldilineaceae bacterium]